MKTSKFVLPVGIIISIIIAVIALYPKTESLNSSLIFTGENDNWQANLQVDTEIIMSEASDGTQSIDTSSDELFTLNYKGDISTLSDFDSITISYESNAGGASTTREGPIESEYIINSSSENSALVSTTAEIKVTITLGSDLEEFYLMCE